MNEEKNTTKETILQKPLTQSIIGIALIFLALGGFIFWQSNYGTLLIENATVSTSIINLSANTSGTLSALYVNEGDKIEANTPIALIGTNIVTSKQNGIVVGVVKSIGKFFAPGETVVSMIHPEDLRIVGALDENKGLEKVKVGQKVTFTVDAFSSKTYVGVVDTISQTADSTGVVFSISDKRPTNKFDVKVRFNVAEYPELKNGMSAKITVYVK